MLIVAVALTALTFGAVVVGFTSALLSLVLRDYTHSMCSSAVVLMSTPLCLIGVEIVERAGPLTYR